MQIPASMPAGQPAAVPVQGAVPGSTAAQSPFAGILEVAIGDGSAGASRIEERETATEDSSRGSEGESSGAAEGIPATLLALGVYSWSALPAGTNEADAPDGGEPSVPAIAEVGKEPVQDHMPVTPRGDRHQPAEEFGSVPVTTDGGKDLARGNSDRGARVDTVGGGFVADGDRFSPGAGDGSMGDHVVEPVRGSTSPRKSSTHGLADPGSVVVSDHADASVPTQPGVAAISGETPNRRVGGQPGERFPAADRLPPGGLSTLEAGDPSAARVTTSPNSSNTGSDTPAEDDGGWKMGGQAEPAVELVGDVVQKPGREARSGQDGGTTPISAVPSAGPDGIGQAGPVEKTVRVESEDGSLVDQLQSHVSRLEIPRNSEIRVRLDPPTLGTVDLRLALKDGLLTLDIIAASSEGHGAIERALPELRQALESRGIEVGQLSLGFGGARDDARGWTSGSALPFGPGGQGSGEGRSPASQAPTPARVGEESPEDGVPRPATPGGGPHLVDYRV